ncbi:MAG: hypothetical protein HQL58_07800 [Magnetococcales bacterium]|nr:hypothetical protein [Magnetococcales bacterium]
MKVLIILSSLRIKILLFFAMALIGLFGVQYGAARLFVIEQSEALEQEKALANLDRIDRLVSEQIQKLESTVSDWAEWDDTWRFMKKRDSKYVSSNYVSNTFTRLKLDLIVVLDQQGQPAINKGFDRQQQQEWRVSPQILERLTAAESPLRPLPLEQGQSHGRSGLLSVADGLFLMATNLVLTSESKGPARGVMAMGQRLDEPFLAQLSNIIRLPLNSYPANHPDMLALSSDLWHQLAQQGRAVQLDRSGTTSSGYILLRDLNKLPAVILKTTMDRHIARQGEQNLQYMLWSSAGIILALLLFSVMLDRWVLNPVSRLSSEVTVIGAQADGSLRVQQLSSDDELARLADGINTMLNHLEHADQQKRMIQGAFGQYLSPKVVDILLKDPNKLSLGGEQRVMTALFSDLAGFSTISEKLSPAELVQLLNEYLTAMCDIITRYDGTVDKFEGDAIMAFWGAPVDQPDHAQLACLAAIDMQQYMTEMRLRLRSERRPALHVRIGLNSGPMVVGNMGSKQRMNYTVMGDAVNLAARLEGANKFYGSHTILSHNTWRMVQEAVDVRELDTIRVVGKNDPVTIYQLLARKGEVSESMTTTVSLYQQGLACYRARNFRTALNWFDQLLIVDDSDGPARAYRERCLEFMRHPPAEDWDGVYQLTAKG